MLVKLILWALFLLPWTLLFFLDRKVVKRYMPTALLAALIVTLFSEMAATYDWWEHYKLFPAFVTNIPIVFGPFVVGTILIFYMSFGHFWIYLALNALVNLIFAYPVSYVFERIGLYQLIVYKHWHIIATAMIWALIIYGFQLWMEEVLRGDGRTGRRGLDPADLLRRWFTKREAAR
ncbi:hypothetical protein IDH44_17365 [Paenibacillus sp. IB182496]|uniref:Uncharacterized protein n=1 Tax=Paenibacillus sabuli TaxID=2772509 RepID=A0A927BWY7_9BACL|nr:hypothetical protein [Paenibacillus sabuli]MBD2846969.1 hypothetical protein [Paenibacillus sabuli]